MTEALVLRLRTPHQVVYEGRLVSARLPTGSGQVGLRPRAEPCIMVIEAGLLLLERGAGTQYAASAGGLLYVAREHATLYTPFAIVGETAAEVLQSLERTTTDPTSDVQTHEQLAELERRILRELQRGELPDIPGRSHA